MVSTRNTPRAASGASESEELKLTPAEPTKKTKQAADSSPTKTGSKVAAGRKRKTEELAPKTSKDEKPTKQAKKATVEEEPDADAGPPKPSVKNTTLDQKVFSDKPHESKEGAIEKGIEEGISDTEILEATENKGKYVEDRSEEQLKAESKSAVSVSLAREGEVGDSPIMEKGIMYFFFRPKVAVEHAELLGDVQRSYIVLRPLPLGAKLKDGKVQDEGNNRLIVVPKKKLPVRGYEKFL